MNKPKEIAPWQVRLIHVAGNQLKLIRRDRSATDPLEDPDPYHQILSGFNGKDGLPAASCKDLNYDQANILLEIFNKLGFKSTAHRSNQFESLFSKERPDDMATVRQLGMIMGVWVQRSREKSLESLNKFCKRIIDVDQVQWLKKDKVSQLLKAIESL